MVNNLMSMSQERFKSLKEMQNEVDANKGGTVNPKELLRLELLISLEKYTKASSRPMPENQEFGRGRKNQPPTAP